MIAAVLVLAVAAAACDVCDGTAEFAALETAVTLAGGDLAGCVCSFRIRYSRGPTRGRVVLSATPGVARIAVYDGDGADDLLVALPETMAVADAEAYSRTGLLRVVVATGAQVPAGASVTLVATAINSAPVFVERDGLVRDSDGNNILVPWSTGGELFPVSVFDWDNLDGSLRAVVVVERTASRDEPSLLASVPATAGLVFEEGSADSPTRRLVVSGPAEAVETALNSARIIPFDMSELSQDTLMLEVSDSDATGTIEFDMGVYAAGVVDVPRGATRLTEGYFPPEDGTDALFLVHDAFRIEVTSLNLAPDAAGACPEYLRVWDGWDQATARLLSTDLFASGEVCGLSNLFLPSYEGTTGEFVVEYRALDHVAPFDTVVSWTPLGFRAWVRSDESVVQVALGGEPLLLPHIMVTSLPDTGEVAVNITASSGALSLRFADSFGDLVQASTDGVLSLSLAEEEDVPAMLRMGDALREVQFVAAEPGSAVVRVEARSGGVAAVPLEIKVEAVVVAINTPRALAVRAFRPVAVGVTVDAVGTVTAEVAVEGGLGLVSLDPRASLWVDIGYGRNVTATGTAGEVNAALESLVYKATEGGGLETIVVRVGSAEQEIEVTVDPDCDGSHFVYAREGSVTERAGAPADRHGTEVDCRWFVTGPRELRFPQFDLSFAHFFVISDIDTELLFFPFESAPRGVLRSNPGTFFDISFNSRGFSSPGFTGVFQRSAAVDDPPVIVVPDGRVRVVRGSTTRLRTLYVDDFTEGVIEASLETDAGWLQEEGTRRVEVVAATFEELDAWVTGIDFLAGDVQTTATLTLTATDDGGAEAVAEFQIEVLACSGTVEVVLEDGSATVGVDDGSGTADHADGLECEWRLTGAPAPALLDVVFLDLACGGDAVTVYDGSNAAGQLLGSFCQGGDVAAEVGMLVSSTGSFFVSFVSDGDGAAGDGFSFVYGAVSSGAATDLGAAPRAADPERTDATVIALDGARVAVFGGHNGVRAVPTTLVFGVDDGWRLLAGAGPKARSRAAGVAVSGSQIVVHGGVDIVGTVVAETWVGDIDGGDIAWTQLPESRGPATAMAAMVVDDGVAHLVDTNGVWVLDGGAWAEIGATPQAVVATTIAYREADSLVYATGMDGALWTLSLATAAWASVGVELRVECAPWTCIGAMLGSDDYVVGGSRVNVTSLAVDELTAAATGHTVGGVYLGQPSLFVFGGGVMTAVPLTLGVSSHGPLVSPETGGTVVTVAGEQLSSCGGPVCEFGAGRAPAMVVSERTATCTTPAGTAVVAVAMVCADGRRYTSPEPLAYFAEPRIEAVEPSNPAPGDTLLITVTEAPAETLSLVEAPLCRFNGATVAAAALDGAELRCRLPDSVLAGATVTVEISLDGQQFVGAAAEIRVAKGRDPLFDKSRATVAGLVLAGVLAVIASFLFARTPSRPPRTVILSVAAGIVDLYFDVVFASKLRDEGSALAEWSFGSLVVVVALNLALVVALVVRKTRLSSGRHAFVHWLETRSGAVLALSIACTLGVARISALALLLTRLGGWAMFDANGMTAKDWHLLATLDVGAALVEDVSQLAIQAVYLSGSSARVDLATVVTVTLSTTMVVYAAFQGLARVVVLTVVRRRKSMRVQGIEESREEEGGSVK